MSLSNDQKQDVVQRVISLLEKRDSESLRAAVKSARTKKKKKKDEDTQPEEE